MIYEIEFYIIIISYLINSGTGAFKLLIVWHTDFWKHEQQKQKQAPKSQPQSIYLETMEPNYNVIHIWYDNILMF